MGQTKKQRAAQAAGKQIEEDRLRVLEILAEMQNKPLEPLPDTKWTPQLVEEEERREFSTIFKLLDKLEADAKDMEETIQTGLQEKTNVHKNNLEGFCNCYYPGLVSNATFPAADQSHEDNKEVYYSRREVEDSMHNLEIVYKEVEIIRKHMTYLEEIRAEALQDILTKNEKMD